MNSKIAQVVVGLPVPGPFDYIIPDELEGKIHLGQRVWVPFGNRKMVGYIVGLHKKSSRKKLKPILSQIDTVAILDEGMLRLTADFSKYYGCSWGEAIETSLPVLLRKGREIDLVEKAIPVKQRGLQTETILVHDQTQSDHWPLLVKTIRETLDRHQGVLIIVPEIVLIENILMKLLLCDFTRVSFLDRRLTPNKELEQWIPLQRGETPLAVGTRSAIFAPVRNLGLIVIYDEDNPAYKQDQSPFYHVREVAEMRANLEGIKLLYVTPAPSAEMWERKKRGQLRYLSYEPRETKSVQIIDMSFYQKQKAPILSFPLREQVQKTIAQNGKIILFMNRKGFSTLTSCTKCGYKVKCPRCDVPLTYLFAQKKMVCRYCNLNLAPPKICPQCNNSYLRYKGLGIERLESELSREFPFARICRYDKETKELSKDFHILITTQAILRLQEDLLADALGVIQIDSELSRPDFRSAQKAFSLLTHLKRFVKGKILIQTFLPDNYCVRAMAKNDFKGFYRKELKLRRELGLPPYKHLIEVMVRSAKKEAAREQAEILFQGLKKNKKGTIEISEPQEDFLPRLRGKYRFNILVRTTSPPKAMRFIRATIGSSKKKAGVIITLNID